MELLIASLVLSFMALTISLFTMVFFARNLIRYTRVMEDILRRMAEREASRPKEPVHMPTQEELVRLNIDMIEEMILRGKSREEAKKTLLKRIRDLMRKRAGKGPQAPDSAAPDHDFDTGG